VELSPFPYQGPLEPHQVHGRDELVADIVERITARRLTALLGPRRYGKTSLARRVAADLAEAGTAVVWLDLYEVASTVDLAVRLDDALAGVAGPFQAAATSVAAGLDVNLGLLKLRFSSRGDRPDPDVELHARLDVLVRAGLTQACVVVIDEFSDIVRVPHFAGLLRTRLQHHFQEIGLLFAGSEPSTMRTLFSERTEPFYGQADLVTVGPLTLAALTGIVGDGFAATDRQAGNLAARIHHVTGGHPQRSMQLADAAWRASSPGADFGPDVWDTALADVRRAVDGACERLFSGFANREKDVLRILAGGGSIFGRAAELVSLSPGAAQAARASLVASGDLAEAEGRHHLTDPLLADWLRHRFPI
jgi:uncharacterized protein